VHGLVVVMHDEQQDGRSDPRHEEEDYEANEQR
jgi:hypothetical protein